MTISVLFDASRLLSRTDRTSPTGVDRVCLAYAEWLLGRADVQMIPVRSKNNELVAVDEAWFRTTVGGLRAQWTGGADQADPLAGRLMEALCAEPGASRSIISQPPPTSPSRRKLPQRLRVWRQFISSWKMSELPSSKFYFNIGHTSLGTPDILASLTAAGVQSVVFLHDLIPITHPEFCRPGDGDKHWTRVLTALRHASRIIVNSQYTADELAAFAKAEGIVPPPIDAVHLGLEPVFVHQPRTPAFPPYFVHVGTIEARKNLAFLLTVWRRLQERMGDGAPRLVLIGRYGWENEAVLDHLERSPNLRGLVHQVENLPDASLVALMAGARAVLAPSSVEGFDLPAVEACTLGVPLIASDIPAHRELVPDAELIDPLDGLGWLRALERATGTSPTVRPYQAPTWDDHFDKVAQTLQLTVAKTSLPPQRTTVG